MTFEVSTIDRLTNIKDEERGNSSVKPENEEGVIGATFG